ncbi:hypothetical protein [Trujillonella endophytica]|uniref:Sporulation and spore germination n=1 Tax=Trujillonella endophytica TaxID=673521 RepID=A0A1H8TJR4_9ACTN|nr:hypothetical protein [Trujillella endophytica]SEO91107.1 hypothetical protein SAMN05660991_02324 [Trujillella endophytica]
MTRTSLRGVLAVLALVLLCSCAERPADDGGGDAGAPPPSPALPEGLVLQVSYTGGYVTPEMLASRLPLLSVYSDGRVLSEGPVTMIYPGPALPNVQLARVDEATVRGLAERALAAGVADTGDLGSPPIADAASTRFTLVTAEGTHVREVYALTEGAGADEQLGDEQRAGRAALAGLLDELTTVTGTASEGYVPDALAVVVRPWTAADDEVEPDLVQPQAPWPGPALPGEPLEPALGLSCLLVAGADVPAVLEAATAANARTPWIGADGARWALTFRPLLPHESDCTALRS